MWIGILLLVVSANLQSSTATIEQSFGKINLTEYSSDGFNCTLVSFSKTFQSNGSVRVFSSMSREAQPDKKNEALVSVITAVNRSFFSLCVMEPARTSGNTTLNWFAINDNNNLPLGISSGSVSYKLFTSGNSCSDVKFSSIFEIPPKVLISIRSSSNPFNQKDMMSAWTESVTESEFRVCLREMTSFSGSHENLHIDWVAMENKVSANMTDLDSIVFSNKNHPTSESNYAYCKIRKFKKKFYAPPTVLVTARRGMKSKSKTLTDQNIVTWIKNINTTVFEVCIKDLPGISGQHEPITVDYAAIGDIDPCLDVVCEKFGVCRAFGPYDPRCVCVTDCPTLEQNVCASNGRSFDNLCLFKLEVCRTKANYTYYHHGSCRGFPMTRGRKRVKEVPQWSKSHCQTIKFEPLTFYPDKSVHVQVSVSHVNDTKEVHDAAVTWVEDVTQDNFTFCVMESGRNEGPPHGTATVEYMAYQGAPSGGLAGVVSIPKWWTGTKCKNVDISTGSFLATPTILATAEHHRLSLKHDAASVWLEDVTNSSFKVCLRELQNFDGPHQDIHVNWLAFETLEQPVFTEHGESYFAKTTLDPLSTYNYAQCQNVSFQANYTDPPTVLVSPKHNTSNNNVDPKYNAITAWLETITTSSFKLCFKELHNKNGYDAVTISHVVLKDICDPEWVYFKGYCYKKISTCESWTNASRKCTNKKSSLVGINGPEEDVFVQHLHNGKPSWIGLNDKVNEGVYLWINGGTVNYTNWAPGVSAPQSKAKDCVQGTGRNSKYHWESASCDECKNYTCQKDYDECGENMHICHSNADCVNTVGSYKCRCRSGYTGNGYQCTDFDECSNGIHTCQENATCINTVGSFTCQCKKGYTGDGKNCSDINECSTGAHTCSQNAKCSNTFGSFTCQCNSGYYGDGFTCSDINECSTGNHKCHRNGNCVNTVGSYRCRCNNGYTGNGFSCSDKNECTLGTYNCNRKRTYCVNTIGSYTCRCRSNYRWNGVSCLAYCGRPRSPSRGYISGSRFTEGSTVYFRCYYYREYIRGSSYTYCQSNGRWSHSTPYCW